MCLVLTHKDTGIIIMMISKIWMNLDCDIIGTLLQGAGTQKIATIILVVFRALLLPVGISQVKLNGWNWR